MEIIFYACYITTYFHFLESKVLIINSVYTAILALSVKLTDTRVPGNYSVSRVLKYPHFCLLLEVFGYWRKTYLY